MKRTYLFPSRSIQPLYIVTSSPLPNGTQGSAYSFQMTANGGTAPYTWSLVSQTGANSFSVSSAGVVSSTAANAETDSLTIKVTDSVGASAQGVFSVQIFVFSGSAWPNGSVNSATLNWVDVNAAA